MQEPQGAGKPEFNVEQFVDEKVEAFLELSGSRERLAQVPEEQRWHQELVHSLSAARRVLELIEDGSMHLGDYEPYRSAVIASLRERERQLDSRFRDAGASLDGPD